MVFMGDKLVGAEFRKLKRGENVFNGGATTGDRVDKRRQRLDSVHQIGLASHLQEILTLVDDGLYGG